MSTHQPINLTASVGGVSLKTKPSSLSQEQQLVSMVMYKFIATEYRQLAQFNAMTSHNKLHVALWAFSNAKD